MKHINLKVIITCLLLNLLIFCANSVYAEQDAKIELTIDENIASVNDVQVPIDENTEVVVFTQNDRTMIPIRFVGENLGLEVSWDNKNSTAILNNDDTTILLKPNSNTANVNGKNIVIDCSVLEKNDRIFVPIRFIAENFSCSVYWDEYYNRIIIKKERDIDINSQEVQRLFNKINLGESFACYSPGYADTELFDTTNYSWMGGLYRELISFLTIKDGFNNEYTDDEAERIIKDFISVGDITDDPIQNGPDDLKYYLENGQKFGDSATETRLVGVIDGTELEEYNMRMFDKPLPKLESRGYSVAYGSFFFYSRNNIVNFISPKLPLIWCNVYYNKANDKYLIFKELQSFSGYTDESSEPFKQETKLIKATKHNDEISVHLYHENEFAEYSGGTDFYKGTYINTYRIDGENYQWICSYGTDE